MMTRRQANAAILAGAALAAVPAATLSQALKPLTLPPARSEGGVPLTQATGCGFSSWAESVFPPLRTPISDLAG